MKNIISITFRLLVKRKGFIASITILPLILFLLMSVFLSYSDQHSIAVINKTDDTVIENTLKDMEGISIQDVKEKKITEKLIICVHPLDLEQKDLDIVELSEYLRYMCRYRYIDVNDRTEGTAL